MSIQSFLLRMISQIFRPVYRWLKYRLINLLHDDSKRSFVLSIGLWCASSTATIIAGLGIPTGIGLVFDLLLYFQLNFMLFVLFAFLFAFLFSLLHLPIPRLFVGSLLYTFASVYLILETANLGSLFSVLIAAAYSVVGIALGLVLTVLTSKTIRPIGKTMFVMVLCVVSLFAYVFWPSAVDPVQSAFSAANKGGIMPPLEVENPAQMGSYSYRAFTYGSGEDRHRKEFGADAALLSSTVDASDYIDDWPRHRQFYWGFDQTELPLNGRVWMPEGEGPFPLVLMVHGNHRMEYFSDAGYAYLGELLASRGFIAVSVDENFLNYSSWSGIPDGDMEPRAWVLLQHLLQIQAFQEQVGNPFYERVDLGQVALIGHSRGGQAAAMAADYKERFAEDSSLEGLEEIKIQAVIGMASTQRSVDGKQPVLRDTYYLALHGARDADVTNFYGDRQYARTTFSKGSNRFKASLYIAEANHSQFNTDWGRMDIRLPGGLFLNRSNIMDPAQQRLIAQVYISAFLETALHGNDQYVDLFRDYRYGQAWLPNTQYVSRFENGRFTAVVDVESSVDQTTFDHDVRVKAHGFSRWEAQEAVDRRGNNKGFKGVFLEWDDSGTYSISIGEAFRSNFLSNKPESLIFSMANLAGDLEEDAGGWGSIPHVEVELRSEGVAAVRLPLDQIMEVPLPVQTTYTRMGWFDEIMREGRYDEAIEPVFQTYEWPLALFEKENPDFDPENLTEIAFHFSSTRGSGSVMLVDIGFQ